MVLSLCKNLISPSLGNWTRPQVRSRSMWYLIPPLQCTEGDARLPSPQRLDWQELLWNEEILVEIGKNSSKILASSSPPPVRITTTGWSHRSNPLLRGCQQQVPHLPIGQIGFELIGSGENSFDFLRKDISYPSNCVSSVAGKEIFLFFVLFGFGRISTLTIKSGLELGWVCVCVLSVWK